MRHRKGGIAAFFYFVQVCNTYVTEQQLLIMNNSFIAETNGTLNYDDGEDCVCEKC